ncbi:hypothetical protein PSN45_000255 [Yamadazyma tenuis]|uniref:uncharacterized protein n=1 Tax=Candida tenuis TaxID=2315449 RepID=UPI0027AA53FF|nr:hypothetical protein PSN45_000255 [Yamadazyma tenuis]
MSSTASPFDDDSDVTEFTPLNSFRRQSFLDAPIGSFRGPNSLHNFASSFTRAQSYAASKLDSEIHRQRSFFHREDENGAEPDELFDPELMIPSQRGERLSTVVHDVNVARNNLFSYDSFAPITDVFYQDDILSALNNSRSRAGSSVVAQGIPIPQRRMYPSPSFSSIRSSLSMATTASHVNLKKIEDKDGNVVTVLAGQSTAPQTIFNSINVLIGVGLLALPVGFLKAGWVIGVPMLLVCGLATFWTASLLSKSMDTDPTLMTYADLGYASYGSAAKLLISLVFSVDLVGAGVSLIVLFSDSLYALLGDDEVWTKTNFKILSFFVLTPFTFMPLPVLSIFSLLGIISTISITGLVFVCGLLKASSPGSLLTVMPTNLWPDSWSDLLLAIGILMAPFGGHAIFPNLKSDMRHPYKFTGTLKVTYLITLITDFTMGVLGFLMFGFYCKDEVTNNLLFTPGYPSFIYPLISGLICMVPIAKTPLNAKPIIATLDSMFHTNTISENQLGNAVRTVGRFLIRVGVNAVFVGLAIVFPEFDKIIGILGASICFLVCIILPCLFYLKLVRIGGLEKSMVLLVIAVSSGLAITGTWAVIAF